MRKHDVDTCVVRQRQAYRRFTGRTRSKQVTYGDASMLLIAPEQLRNAQIRQALDRAADRALGLRRGALASPSGGMISGRITAMRSGLCATSTGQEAAPQVLCVTATAKQKRDRGYPTADPRRRRGARDTALRRRPGGGEGAARTNLTSTPAFPPVAREGMSKPGLVSEAVAAQDGTGATPRLLRHPQVETER